MTQRDIRMLLILGAVLILQGCATLAGRDPPQVTVAGIEPLQGQGLELRMLVKLRVQNPNDAAIDYDGVAVEMNVQGKTFASGVSDANGSIPRFGEAVIAVPVTVSAFRMVRQAIGMAQGAPGDKIEYEMRGKLNSTGFGAARFATRGEFNMPSGASPAP